MSERAWPQSGTLALWYARVPKTRLAEPTATFERQLGCLTAAESQRAKRYLFAEPRNRFIVARWMLRNILGQYCDQSPSSLDIQTTPNEKPFLGTAPQLQFNISHSGEVIVLTVANGQPVGVDTEQIDSSRDWQMIAKHQFHPAEQQWLQAQPTPVQAAGFYEIWTAKEAYLKGLGVGLGHPLTGFAIIPDRPVRQPQPELDPLNPWSIRSLKLFEDYAVAVACQHELRVEEFKFEI